MDELISRKHHLLSFVTQVNDTALRLGCIRNHRKQTMEINTDQLPDSECARKWVVEAFVVDGCIICNAFRVAWTYGIGFYSNCLINPLPIVLNLTHNLSNNIIKILVQYGA